MDGGFFFATVITLNFCFLCSFGSFGASKDILDLSYLEESIRLGITIAQRVQLYLIASLSLYGGGILTGSLAVIGENFKLSCFTVEPLNTSLSYPPHG